LVASGLINCLDQNFTHISQHSMYVCMYVCMCVCVFVRNIFVSYKQAGTHVRVCVCVCVCVCVKCLFCCMTIWSLLTNFSATS
jgi:hypothetical protein